MAVLNSAGSYATETMVTRIYNCGNTARLTAFLHSIGLAPTVQTPIS